GGTSLTAAHMLRRVREQFGRELPMSTLVHTATVEYLAGLLQAKELPNQSDALVTLQAKGTKPPLFLVHGMGGEILNYMSLPRYLGEDQPLYALRGLGAVGSQEPFRRAEQMAAYYLQQARSVTQGPLLLGGFSFGAVIAFEMAQQLQAQGCP